MTIGFLGGVPPALGGGGLEVQMERTAGGLKELGHRVLRVECARPEERLDVLHGFHAEPALWHLSPHWTRNRAPLVVSPVLPVRPGVEPRRLFLAARLPGVLTTARMRHDVMRQAEAVIALTHYERRLVERVFGARSERVAVIGNGADRSNGAEPPLPEGVPDSPFALMLGNVSRRKRQLEVLNACSGRRIVVAGDVLEDGDLTRELEEACRASGSVWLGPVQSAEVVRALLRRADALVLLSAAEAQPLAVLEALAENTPAVISDLPPHRELRAAYPGWIELVRDPADLSRALDALERQERRQEPHVPTWRDVAGRLVEVYRQAGAGP